MEVRQIGCIVAQNENENGQKKSTLLCVVGFGTSEEAGKRSLEALSLPASHQ